MNQVNRWNFAAFELDLPSGVLKKDGQAVRIGRQAFRALALLVSRGGELVTREELQKEVWGDRVHVDFEHGLNVCIRQVRTALGPEVDGTQIVVTCPREGYRLGVAVTPVMPVMPVTAVAATRATDSYLRRLALNVVEGRWVAAAAILALVVGGSFVLASIIGGPAASSTTVGGVAIGPSTVSTSMFERVGFSRPWPTQSTEAYAWYWRGRGYYDRATGRKPAGALPFFETAATLDPNFALAHASLAVSYLDRAAQGVARAESIVKARQAAQRALDLGGRYAETHVALAELHYRVDGDMLAAEREFVRAVELDPRNAYARQRYAAFLHEQRQFERALEQLRVAQEFEPLSVLSSWQTANALFYLHRYDDAMTQAAHTLELDPSHAWSFRTIGQSLEAMGKPEEAIAEYMKAGQVALGHLGRAYVLAGRKSEARTLLAALTRRPVEESGHNGVAIAFIHTALDEPAKAMEWLEKTRRDGVRLPFSLRIAPQWEPLRASSGFSEFLKKNEVAGS